MNMIAEMSSLNRHDVVAVAILIAVWAGLGWRIEHPTAKHRSMAMVMSDYNRDWMIVMLTRDPRVFDAQILSSLRQGTAFFATTCLFAIGGVLALIGNVDPLLGVVEGITAIQSPATVWQIKLVLVLLLLGNAFLKFVWANRVYSYCAVVMAAVPNDAQDPQALHMARKAGDLNARAALNFNRGLLSMYFALASVALLAGPLPLFVTTAVTAAVVWNREFASVPRAIIMDDTKA